MNNTATAAKILDTNEAVDALDSFDSVQVSGRNLKSGMVIVDPELGTPVYILDHRMGSNKASSGGRWFVYSFVGGMYSDAPQYATISLIAERTYPVVAR